MNLFSYRSSDTHLPNFPTIIRLYHYHNHASEAQPLERLNEDLWKLFSVFSEKVLNDHKHFKSPFQTFINSANRFETDTALISALQTFGKGINPKATVPVNQSGCASTLKNTGVSSAGKKRPIKTMNGDKGITKGRPPKKRTLENGSSRCKEKQSPDKDYIPECIITINPVGH